MPMATDPQTMMPPTAPGSIRPAQQPSQGYAGMVGQGGQGGMGGAQGVSPTPGMGQMATIGIRIGMEIDMNLKQLAQIAPPMTPWIQRVSEELKLQLAQAMSGGGIPSTPAGGQSMWPDGTGRL